MAEEDWDLEKLEDLATVMEDASICGLGQAAPNPLRCVVKYFPQELGITDADADGQVDPDPDQSDKMQATTASGKNCSEGDA